MKVQKENFDQKLMVEGNTDKHVIWALCQKFNLQENFDVIDSGSKEQAVSEFISRIKIKSDKTLACIIDADSSIESTWQSISTKLTNLGYIIPEILPPSGLIIEQNELPKVGVWIMPNNILPGKLEDFIAFLVPENDKLFSEVNSFLAKLENEEKVHYKEKDKPKAQIHSWLALQESPGSPLGLAITQKYLTTDEKTCKILINWLTKLFK